MHTISKIGMLAWTVICFVGSCSGMMRVADRTGGNMSNAEALGTGLGMFVWLMIWFFPIVGMGIIALVTKPREKSPQFPLPDSTLCSTCGKYYTGAAHFCPHCGGAQKQMA
jgi:hypothetical protein